MSTTLETRPDASRVAPHHLREDNARAWSLPRVRRLAMVVLVLAILVGWCALALVPIAWMLSTSLKTPPQVFRFPPQWWPAPATLANYAKVLTATPFPRFFLNSLVVASAVTLGQVVSSVLAAFAFARLRFWGRDALFLLFLGTLMIPEQMTYVPLFVVARFLSLVNSYTGLILPALVTPFGIFLMRQAFRCVPQELEDAATLDGCGPWGTLWHVFLPVVRPTLVTLALFAFLGSWNAYFWPLIVTQSTDMRTLPVGLRYYLRDAELGTDWGVLMAGSALVLAPVIVLFLVAQRHFIAGLLSGSVKG